MKFFLLAIAFTLVMLDTAQAKDSIQKSSICNNDRLFSHIVIDGKVFVEQFNPVRYCGQTLKRKQIIIKAEMERQRVIREALRNFRPSFMVIPKGSKL